MNQPLEIQTPTADAAVPKRDDLAPIREKIKACIQCGTCTGSCPNAFAMDITPRKMWRMVLISPKDEIFSSRTFALCSACYYCTLRCPRGLPLNEAMGDLKQIAARERIGRYKESTDFYRCFMDSVRKHGRVRETEFISHYFLAMAGKKPFLGMKYTPLGIRLMKKGKLAVTNPFSGPGKRSLDAVFRKVESMREEASA